MADLAQEAALAFESLVAPVAEADPCGPDLDVEGDAAYMNFMAAGEGLLPATFYSPRDGRPFDRSQIDFPAQYATIAAIAAVTRDLRLIILLAKLRILDRDLSGFVAAVRALAELVERRWEHIHPRGEDGDYTLRMVALQSLDDMSPVILPLQYAPLFEHKRFGVVAYRMHLLSSGETPPRGEEERPDPSLVRRAFEEVALETLVARRDELRALGEALARIRNVFIAQVGAGAAPAFPKLAPLVDSMRALVDSFVMLRDPAAGEAAPDDQPAEGEADGAAPGAAPAPAGDVRSFADAAAALNAVGAYFMRREPSNPALLLVRQAEQLIGKSFLDVLRVLTPRHVEEAKLQIGRTQFFDLPVERLSEFASIEEAEPDGADAKIFTVTTREGALQLMSKVGSFYQQAEPSSPISYLLERARAVTGRDFLGLLRDMLPPDTLKSLDA